LQELVKKKNFDNRLRVVENRVLRKILEPKRDEVKGVMRRLYNVELYTL
jgi:hypothetical protein